MTRSPISHALGLQRTSPVSLAALLALTAAVVLSTLVSGPEVALAAVVGPAVAFVILSRPEYGVILMFSSFLVTYPRFLQGGGLFTINNVMAALLGATLAIRMVRHGDFGFLQRREWLLLALIGAVLLISRYVNEPDAHTMALVGPYLRVGDQDPARMFVNRFIFFTFFIAFIRSIAHTRILFLLAVALMVLTGLAGIWYVLSGWGFAGYRARAAFFIGTAGNPNRMALFSVIGFTGLWYLLQRARAGWQYAAVLPFLAAMVLSVFMAGSRSGVMGLGLATVILMFEGGLSPRKIVVSIIGGLLALALVVNVAPEESIERATGADTTLGEGSYQRRAYGAGFALELARDRPLFGVGVGNWEITRYLEDPARRTTPPHSSYLLTLVEGGVVTLGLYLLLLGWTLKNFLDAENAARAGITYPPDMIWVLSTLRTGFVVFLFFSLIGDLWEHIIFYWFVGLGSTLRFITGTQGLRRAAT
jgi:O-antigen ligase